MSKKPLAIILASLLLLTSCGKKDEEVQSEPEVTKEVVKEPYRGDIDAEEEEEEEEKTPEEMNSFDVSCAFMQAILDGDMETAYSFIDVSDDTFFNQEIFSFVLKRTELAWLMNNSSIIFDSCYTHVNRNLATAEANLSTYDGGAYTYALDLNLNDENVWKISTTNFAMSDVRINVPVGTRFFLDEEEVSKKYIKMTTMYFDIYELPLIGRKDWTTHVLSSLFGESESSLEIPYYDPNSEVPEDKEFNITSSVSDLLFNEVSKNIKNIYSAFYTNAETNNFEGVKANISPSIEADTLLPIFNKAVTAISESNISNIEVIGIDPLPDYPSFITSESEVIMNIGVHFLWKHEEELCESAQMTACQLEKIGDDWLLTDIRPNVFVTFENGLNEYTTSSLDGYNK